MLASKIHTFIIETIIFLEYISNFLCRKVKFIMQSQMKLLKDYPGLFDYYNQSKGKKNFDHNNFPTNN